MPLEVLAVASVDCSLPIIGRFIGFKVDCFLAPLGAMPLGGARNVSATAVVGGLASFPLEVLAVTSVDCLLPTIGGFGTDCFLAPLGAKPLGEPGL